MKMEGKVAIVTGAAGGIGRAIACLFAAEGACIAITDINTEEGQKVADQIASLGGRSTFVYLDVTDEENWKSVVAVTVKEFGKINVLVNNAGAYSPEVVDQTNLDNFQQKRLFVFQRLGLYPNTPFLFSPSRLNLFSRMPDVRVLFVAQIFFFWPMSSAHGDDCLYAINNHSSSNCCVCT